MIPTPTRASAEHRRTADPPPKPPQFLSNLIIAQSTELGVTDTRLFKPKAFGRGPGGAYYSNRDITSATATMPKTRLPKQKQRNIHFCCQYLSMLPLRTLVLLRRTCSYDSVMHVSRIGTTDVVCPLRHLPVIATVVTIVAFLLPFLIPN